MDHIIVNLHSSKLNRSIGLVYEVLEIPIAKQWLELLRNAIKQKKAIRYGGRFVGFPGVSSHPQHFHNQIAESVIMMNRFLPSELKIDEEWIQGIDQDKLNRLHKRFDLIHGPKGVTSEVMLALPREFHEATDCLNNSIHAVEKVSRTHDGTYNANIYIEYEECERRELPEEAFSHFTFNRQFGDLYLHYSQVGKPLYEFSQDEDEHMDADNLRPQRWFSESFVLRFIHWQEDRFLAEKQKLNAWAEANGYDISDPKWCLGQLVVARMVDMRGSRKGKTMEEAVEEIGNFTTIESIVVSEH